jgi:hypothetical protein
MPIALPSRSAPAACAEEDGVHFGNLAGTEPLKRDGVARSP